MYLRCPYFPACINNDFNKEKLVLNYKLNLFNLLNNQGKKCLNECKE